MEIVLSFVVAVAVFLALVAFFGSFFTVQTAEVAIITRFGRYLRSAQAGLNWKFPFIDKLEGRMSLRVNQMYADHGDQDARQCLRHHSDFGADEGAA